MKQIRDEVKREDVSVKENFKHSSQTDAAKGFGGRFGVQQERKDKVCVCVCSVCMCKCMYVCVILCNGSLAKDPYLVNECVSIWCYNQTLCAMRHERNIGHTV